MQFFKLCKIKVEYFEHFEYSVIFIKIIFTWMILSTETGTYKVTNAEKMSPYCVNLSFSFNSF